MFMEKLEQSEADGFIILYNEDNKTKSFLFLLLHYLMNSSRHLGIS